MTKNILLMVTKKNMKIVLPLIEPPAKMSYLKIFFDTEFTGLFQNAKLLSIALVAETGEIFYAERALTPELKIGNWVQKNVIDNFFIGVSDCRDVKNIRIKGNESEIREGIELWLKQFDSENSGNQIQFWGDCPAWDWVLFCELFGGAMKIPTSIHFMCMDIATLFYTKGYQPDKPRIEFLKENQIKIDGRQHNALFDAEVAKTCYEILEKINE